MNSTIKSTLIYSKLFKSTIPRTSINQIKEKRRWFSSTDQTEVKKFDKFSTSSDHDWYTSELMRPLRNMNKLRVPLIKNQLLSDRKFNKEKINEHLPLENLSLLDVGSGGGLLSECLARLGANVTAIDANEHNIKFAKDHLSKSNLAANQLNYIHSDLDNFKSENKKFDGIIASEILEHVDSVDEFIRTCSKLLHENGLLFITTINQTVQSYLFAIKLAENVLNLVPKNTHQYEKLVLLNGLCLILEENNLNVELVHGMCFNPINNDWSWCEDTSINYALVARKINK